jgi:hypothetical protein
MASNSAVPKIPKTVYINDVGVLYHKGNATAGALELPMSGGTYNQVDYPDLYNLISTSQWLFGTANTVNKTFTLKNLNTGAAGGLGYFLSGSAGQPIGTLQDDATAVNGLNWNAIGANNETNGNTNRIIYQGDGGGNQLGTNGGVAGVTLTGDTETRPYTARALIVVKAKPTPLTI